MDKNKDYILGYADGLRNQSNHYDDWTFDELVNRLTVNAMDDLGQGKFNIRSWMQSAASSAIMWRKRQDEIEAKKKKGK